MTTNNNDKFIREGIIALCACFICILICIGSIMGFTYAMLVFHIVLFACISLCITYFLYRKHIESLEKDDKQSEQGKSAINSEPEMTKPYGTTQRKKRFLTRSESEFKALLIQRLPTNVEVHCNVAIRSILEKEVNDKIDNRIFEDRKKSMLYVDYALINNRTEGIILVIELDGHSHDNPETKEKDAMKDQLLNDSRIPIIRVKFDKKNDSQTMTEILERCKAEMI